MGVWIYSYNTEELFDFGTLTTTGTTASRDTKNGFDKWTWHILTDASASNTTVRLEGSIDDTNWFILDEWEGTGNTMRHIVNKPVRYIRINVVSMGDASSISVMVWGIR